MVVTILLLVTYIAYWIGFFAGHFVAAKAGSLCFEAQTFKDISVWALIHTGISLGVILGFGLLMGGGLAEALSAAGVAKIARGQLAIEGLALIGISKLRHMDFDPLELWLFCIPIAGCRLVVPMFVLLALAEILGFQ